MLLATTNFINSAREHNAVAYSHRLMGSEHIPTLPRSQWVLGFSQIRTFWMVRGGVGEFRNEPVLFNQCYFFTA